MNRKVEICVYEKDQIYEEVRLIGWAIESENIDGIPSIYTVAIICLSDGSVETCSLGKLRFPKS